MANPFPGMDPYLEGPLWTTVHSNLTEEIARQLAPKVRPKYVPVANQRIVLATPDRTELAPHCVPDVGVPRTPAGERTAGGPAVAPAPLVLEALTPVPIPQTTVEIRDVARRRLVTAIEVLSPTNKRGDGRREYERKRRQLLRSTAHLLEIDLIRIGRRFPVARELPPAPYFAFLSRAGRRGQVEVWPIPLDEPLPTVLVPLLPEDPDVPLDLQAALAQVYNLFGYDELLDYGRPPPGPLSAEQAAWVARRLREAGRRP
jgi:hypothetical protein